MMKTKKMLAILTASAALTSSMALNVYAENTDPYAYKTKDYLIEKYYYDENLNWSWLDANEQRDYSYAHVDEASRLKLIYEDENGNPCTIEEAGWIAAGAWSNPYRYYYYGNEAQYVNCQKSGAFYYAVKEDGTAMLVGYDSVLLAELGDTLEIPSELDGYVVNELGEDSFKNVRLYVPTIKKVVVPDSIEIIRKDALRAVLPDDSPAGSINIPNNVKYIGYGAYGGLGTALGEVIVLPESLEYIQKLAFDCTIFWAVDYPDTPFLATCGLYIPDLRDYYTAEIASPFDEENETNFEYVYRIEKGYYEYFEQYSADPNLTVPLIPLANGGVEEGEIFELPKNAIRGVTFDKNCTSDRIVICEESLVYLSGDLNKDKAVNIADLTMISRYVAEDTDLSITANGKANADVNRDNEVNAMDINALAMKLAIE